MVAVPDIAKIMSTEGPIIKAVVLQANGEMEEVRVVVTAEFCEVDVDLLIRFL